MNGPGQCSMRRKLRVKENFSIFSNSERRVDIICDVEGDNRKTTYGDFYNDM